MYYSAAQQLARHANSSRAMTAGDLLGSGAISGPEAFERVSMLELSWGGKYPITLPTGQTRNFLEDGDTLTLERVAIGEDFQIGFGTCSGTIKRASSSN